MPVYGTHWQYWPEMDQAVEDDRDLTHSQWFHHFVQQANIVPPISYRPPPVGKQLGLPGV